MKRFTITICAAIFLCSCNDTKTEDKKATTDSGSTAKMDDKQPPMDSAAMMKAWQTYMTPGSIHAMLAKSSGTWEENVTMYMPGAPPSKNMSTAVNTMILGGRYQQSHHTGTFNGMPFEGISTVGYDNGKKMFESSWVDNLGTGIMNMEGTWDSTTHTINFKGKMTDPGSGKDMDVREIFTLVDDNNQKMEMFATEHGKESKTMEISLKRK